MNFSNKKMYWTYTILALICTIGAVVFGFLANYSEKKEDPKPLKGDTIFNINGDYVNRDKNIKKSNVDTKEFKPKTEVKTLDKSINDETINENESLINNGIINSGNNYGSQTVNNYNNTEQSPRKINNEDVNLINAIPKDYKITFLYVSSFEETINYAEQIFNEIKKAGYNIIEVNSTGMYLENGGKPHKRGERIYLTLDDESKIARVIIREQK